MITENIDRHLLVLGCSSTKIQTQGNLPAIQRYDGPMYRVLRSFLRGSVWPSQLSVAVLSAKYGLIGGLAPIDYYDQRMDASRASELVGASTKTLLKWSGVHNKISLALGKEYLPALDFDQLRGHGIMPIVVDGPIGMKQRQVHELIRAWGTLPRPSEPKALNRPLYFLPDWDDTLDTKYDFATDSFSASNKAERNDRHCVQVMMPYRICDGVLVSLAQHVASRGVLKRYAPTDIATLAPQAMRKQFGLSNDQWVFGDCGAFSYVNESKPIISTEQALSMYEIYGFDLGASVDHIPVPEIIVDKDKRELTLEQRRERVELTKKNAAEFLALHKQRKCTFIPIGVIQGIDSNDYASQLPEYIEMGYRHIAIGGLVPRGDAEILGVVNALEEAKRNIRHVIWIHLFGIFRPKIQNEFRRCGITSFDSATYFRKAWLRSDQNYLGIDGNWYAAIRVPMTSDARTRKRLEASGLSFAKLEALEKAALQALHDYDKKHLPLQETLEAIAEYDITLNRNSEESASLTFPYQLTLTERPWEKCQCPVCSTIGIDVVIFRGCNRNKRRGAHNTAMLYRLVSGNNIAI